ncbi:phosphatase PAP2 family protein [Cohnella cholangitidis]|uniref:Phosphatase PAP2 family protein n=1 Tax=Cohnella cholangitidis TaxID=2598458 RepID=A0A7G5BV82_9BACL|nr:phosphatase PAP2 family protein [Cohnella cholangitidis]QMV40866.1 phosphatase PAP2 family protein [Cohnella cholangitidis]
MELQKRERISPNARSRMSAYKPLLGLLAVPVINFFYVMQNHPGGNVLSLVTEVDRSTPFISEFAAPYMLWYPFLFLVFFLVLRQDKIKYYRLLLALCIGLLLSNLVYLFFQTTVPRPEVESTGFFNHLVAIVYANDEPYNCFPSIHVLSSTLMIFGLQSLRWRWRIPLAAFAMLIIASTLFIKQHVIADLLAGMLLAKFAFWLAGKMLPVVLRRTAAFRRKRGARYADYK